MSFLGGGEGFSKGMTLPSSRIQKSRQKIHGLFPALPNDLFTGPWAIILLGHIFKEIKMYRAAAEVHKSI